VLAWLGENGRGGWTSTKSGALVIIGRGRGKGFVWRRMISGGVWRRKWCHFVHLVASGKSIPCNAVGSGGECRVLPEVQGLGRGDSPDPGTFCGASFSL